jgi:hypothetical protein
VHTSIDALGRDYPKQIQKMVVADMILSTNIKNAKPFVDQPTQKEIVQNNFQQVEFNNAFTQNGNKRKPGVGVESKSALLPTDAVT